jgi:hypothetical protein
VRSFIHLLLFYFISLLAIITILGVSVFSFLLLAHNGISVSVKYSISSITKLLPFLCLIGIIPLAFLFKMRKEMPIKFFFISIITSLACYFIGITIFSRFEFKHVTLNNSIMVMPQDKINANNQTKISNIQNNQILYTGFKYINIDFLNTSNFLKLATQFRVSEKQVDQSLYVPNSVYKLGVELSNLIKLIHLDTFSLTKIINVVAVFIFFVGSIFFFDLPQWRLLGICLGLIAYRLNLSFVSILFSQSFKDFCLSFLPHNIILWVNPFLLGVFGLILLIVDTILLLRRKRISV